MTTIGTCGEPLCAGAGAVFGAAVLTGGDAVVLARGEEGTGDEVLPGSAVDGKLVVEFAPLPVPVPRPAAVELPRLETSGANDTF